MVRFSLTYLNEVFIMYNVHVLRTDLSGRICRKMGSCLQNVTVYLKVLC